MLCSGSTRIYDTFGKPVRVTSPAYPDRYNVAGACVEDIRVDTVLPVVLQLEQQFTDTQCTLPYSYRVVDTDNAPLDVSLITKCEQLSSSAVFSAHALIKIGQPRPVLQIVLPEGPGNGFRLLVTGIV